MKCACLCLLLAPLVLAADIVDVVTTEPKTSTLAQLVSRAGLVDVLKGGTFTVFAPTDAAFGRVDQNTLGSLLTDPTGALADLLKYHVVAGAYESTDLMNEEVLTSVAGQKIRFNSYTHNKVATVNGVKISQADIKTTNGYIHLIDDVIMPPTQTIKDLVAADPDLSTLLSAVVAAGIADEFIANPETLFAPTNAAFAAVDQADLNKLLGDKARLKETLEYHAVPHTLYSVGLYNNEFPKSSDSHEDRLRVEVDANGVEVNNAKVIQADLKATNGVMHKIDKVLIPIRVGFWLRTNIGK